MTNRIRSRKTWDQSGTETKPAFQIPQPVSRTERDYALIREEVSPRYEQLLSELERKNREKKQLTQTRDEREEREEGFSLYFNGTHAQKGRSRSETGQGDPAKAKLNKVRNEASKENLPKTAPSKRKSWKAASCVSLKTEQGEQLELELSPKLTGVYSDDFEDPLPPKKHPPIQLSSDGSDSEISDHCEEELNTSTSRPLKHAGALEFCRDTAPPKSSGPSRSVSTCSVTSVRVRQDLDESVQDLQGALSAIRRENSRPLLSPEVTPPDSPEEVRDSLDTTYVDTAPANVAPNTFNDYWHNHSLFGEMDKLKGVKILMEVSSNWGHPSLIGLTEIEFFTTQNKKVWLSGTRLMAEGQFNTSELDHILNGKTHSTHEKHMWASHYRVRRRIRFHFLVPIGSKYELRGVRIWNYNKPCYLEAGVRGVKIMVENVSVWEGEVPKGCGNRTNDYAHNILIYIPEPSPSNVSSPDWKSVSDCKKSSDSKEKSVELMEKSFDCKEKSIDCREKSNNCRYKQVVRVAYNPFKSPVLATNSEPSTPLLKLNSPHLKPQSSPQLTNQSKNQFSNQNDHSSNQNNQSSNQINHSPDLTPVNTPIRRHLNHSFSHTNLLDTLFSPGVSLEKSYSESELSKLLSADSEARAPSHGRRSQMRLGTAVTGKARPELPDAELTDVTHLYAPKNTRNPLASKVPTHSIHTNTSRRNTPSLQCSRTEPIIGAKPAKPSLDEMLQSLATFQVSHKGRLAQVEDDTLNQFLEERGRTRDTALKLEPDVNFRIPELPYGKFLTLSISSTWGDRHYLGLNGIEAFSSDGNKVEICDIVADPPDINILPGYGSDPRVARNLVDGINRTRDDLHMWLTPFTPGNCHLVHLEFSAPSHLAMLRIWNYNKSRIHSHRGAKCVRIELDSAPVFMGEIARASGGLLGGTESFGDTILFTEDENILSLISEHDETYQGDLSDGLECELSELEDSFVSRPDTSDKERPFTTAGYKHLDTEVTDCTEFVAQKVSLCLLNTWSEEGVKMGLTGVAILAPDTSVIDLTPDQVQLFQISPDGTREPLEVEIPHLLSGNLTPERDDMLLWELDEGCQALLEICLPAPMPLGGVSIWNYNFTPEDSYAGVMQLEILLDDTEFWPLTLRRAPGHLKFQFGQDILFSANSPANSPGEKIDTSALMPLFTPHLAPTGFVVEVQILSTWGDTYYVGLSGIELFDWRGHKIHLEDRNVAAYPESINILEGVDGDLRTPDKLVDGTHSSQDGAHSWLTPLLPNVTPSIYIIFDEPVSLSAVRIWNYVKTLSRGVNEFSILMDDLIIYHGAMPPTKSADHSYLALLHDQSPFENSPPVSEAMPIGDPIFRPFTSLTTDS